ncbi:MAG TPA: hypothetical protein VE781_07265, partial [Kineosporiaceae bacterium]|nr:hypothetical protein [Kineosporiaceae bacterium]
LPARVNGASRLPAADAPDTADVPVAPPAPPPPPLPPWQQEQPWGAAVPDEPDDEPAEEPGAVPGARRRRPTVIDLSGAPTGHTPFG